MTKMLEGVVKEGTARVGVYNGALVEKRVQLHCQMTIREQEICGSLVIHRT